MQSNVLYDVKLADSVEFIKDLKKLTYLAEKSIFLFVASPDKMPKKDVDAMSLYWFIKSDKINLNFSYILSVFFIFIYNNNFFIKIFIVLYF